MHQRVLAETVQPVRAGGSAGRWLPVRAGSAMLACGCLRLALGPPGDLHALPRPYPVGGDGVHGVPA